MQPRPVPTRGAATDAAPAEADIFDYLAILAMRKWTIVGTVALALGLVLLHGFSAKPIYEASASLLIEPSTPRVLANVTEVTELGPRNDDAAYYNTQHRILTSDSLFEDVARRAQLKDDPEFFGFDPSPANARVAEQLAAADPLPVLQDRVGVSLVRDSQIAKISVRDTSPNRAALLANMIGDVYVERNSSMRTEATRNAVAWLEAQLGDLQKQLRTTEQALDKFMHENGILSVSLKDRQNSLSVELDSLSRALSETRIKRLQLDAEQPEGSSAGASTDPMSSPQLAADPNLQALVGRLDVAKEELAEVAKRYTPAHPRYVRIASRVDEIERQMQEHVSAILAVRAEQRHDVRRLEEELSGALARAKEKALELNHTEIEYNQLQREYDSNKTIHDMVFTRFKETSLTGMLDTNNARFLDRAKVPASPVWPKIPRNLVLGLVLGLVVGIGLAFLLWRLDDTIKRQEDIEGRVGVPLLGVVPTVGTAAGPRWAALSWLKRTGVAEKRLTAADLYVHTHPRSAVAESCRAIRSNLVFSSPDRPLKSIVITSAESGAGKTSTAVKLAALLAQTQGRTLLVDADMRCGRLHDVFGLTNDTGLSTVIVGEGTLESTVKKTELPDVDVMTCGRTPPNAAELLHSGRFAELAEEMTARYRLVVFDTPPILSVTDAVIVSKHATGALAVARWGKTRAGMLSKAIDQLKELDIRLLGVVLNDLDLNRRTYAYYYYRSYGNYQRYGNTA